MTLSDPRDVVALKRDGKAVPEEDLRAFVQAYGRGEIGDYLAAAFLMAGYINGLDAVETLAMTRAMVDSGRTIELPGISRPTVDKHSTGRGGRRRHAGVRAARGIARAGGGQALRPGPRAHGRDARQARVDPRAADRPVAGGTPSGRSRRSGAPSRRRPRTSCRPTAPCTRCATRRRPWPPIPFIAASVMSKKLAIETDLILLDVKAGTGAFMKTPEDAMELARACSTLADGWGRRARVAVTDMNQPLGEAVGNALDVAEAVELLRGGGRGRLRELTLLFARASGRTAAWPRRGRRRRPRRGGARERRGAADVRPDDRGPGRRPPGHRGPVGACSPGRRSSCRCWPTGTA